MGSVSDSNISTLVAALVCIVKKCGFNKSLKTNIIINHYTAKYSMGSGSPDAKYFFIQILRQTS